MNYLSVEDIVELHNALISTSGGPDGIRAIGLLESAVVQPQSSAFGQELYRTVVEKAAALLFSLVKNHAFIDGNKRIAQAATERFLLENGFEIVADVEEQEAMVLAVAASEAGREELILWLSQHIAPA